MSKARCPMRPALVALLLGAWLAISACGSGRPARTVSPPAASPARAQFGASVNRLFDDQRYSPRQIEAELHALAQTGASLARTDTLWDATETEPPSGGRHRYDWRFDDAVAASLAGNRLKWFPVLDYSPGWAQSLPGVEHSAPRNPADFAAFARAFAARYGHSGRFWQLHPMLPMIPVDTYEVWNEPDNAEFWKPSPDPSHYAALYAQARDAVESVDPAARVIVGGLMKPVQFLPALLAAAPGLRNAVDGIAIHPYGATPAAVTQSVRHVRSTMRVLRLQDVPLYVTEFGWVTSPRASRHWAPPRLRPRYLRETLAAVAHSNCGIAAVIAYTWITPEQNSQNQEDWFGIHPLGSSGTADTAGFSTGLRLAAKPGAPLPIC
jgi:hypothetical protein